MQSVDANTLIHANLPFDQYPLRFTLLLTICLLLFVYQFVC